MMRNYLLRQIVCLPLLIVTLMAPQLAGAGIAYAAPGVTVARELPAQVSPGETFQVKITFSAPADSFTSLGVSDFAPLGWTPTANNTWCTPAPDQNKTTTNATTNRIDYLWFTAGPYPQGTGFTVVYRLTVPSSAAPGAYNFTRGYLEYYNGTGQGPFISDVTGNSSITVAGTVAGTPTITPTPTPTPTPGVIPPPAPQPPQPSATPTVTSTPTPTPKPSPTLAPTPPSHTTVSPKPTSPAPVPSASTPPASSPSRTASSPQTTAVPPAGSSSPTSQGETMNWLVLGGIVVGVVICGLLVFFLVSRRASKPAQPTRNLTPRGTKGK